jgi:hypothetical protein
VKIDEGYIEVEGGRVWYRCVGPDSDADAGIPLSVAGRPRAFLRRGWV